MSQNPAAVINPFSSTQTKNAGPHFKSRMFLEGATIYFDTQKDQPFDDKKSNGVKKESLSKTFAESKWFTLYNLENSPFLLTQPNEV